MKNRMKNQYLISLAIIAALAGCASSQQASEPSPVEEEVYRSVEEVWPEVVAKQPKKRTTQNAKSSSEPAVKLPRKSNFVQRRVVQVKAPVSGGYQDNIQEGLVRGVHNITSLYGENHTVPVALNYPSLVLTPFANPVMVGEKTVYESKQFGPNFMIKPMSSRRFMVMIYDESNPTLPISLTLVPQAKLSSQTISVATGGLSPAEKSGGKIAKQGGLAQNLSEVLQEIVKGKLPSGYTVRPLRETIRMANGMSSTPIQRYSSSQFDVYRYRLKNTTQTPQVLAEEMFGANKRVMAVAFYPKVSVYPGETTDVLIMVSKQGAK